MPKNVREIFRLLFKKIVSIYYVMHVLIIKFAVPKSE